MTIEKEKLISLVTEAQKGDNAALSELFNTFYNDFYYFALKTVKDEDTALDVTQEAFIEIMNTIGALKEPAAFVTWAKQVVYHQCTRYFKKKKDILVDEDEEGGSIFDTVKEESADFIPDEALDKADFKKTILSILDGLSEEQRSATMMYYFDEMSVKEIAAIQGVSEGTVKSRLNYARRSIKTAVEEYEKKNGVKLHALPFLPLFKWLFDGAFEGGLSASAATALAEGVSAASGVTVSVSAAAGGAASAVGVGIGAKLAAIPLAAKLVAGAIAAAVVIGISAAAVIGGGDKAPSDRNPSDSSPTISTPSAGDGNSAHTHEWGEWTVTEESFGVIKVESKSRSCTSCKETEKVSDLDDRWGFLGTHFGGEDYTFLDRYFDIASVSDGPFDINGLFAAGDFLASEPHYVQTGEPTTQISAEEYFDKLGQYFTLTDEVIGEMKQIRPDETFEVSFDYQGANLMLSSCVYKGGNIYTVYYTASGSHAAYMPVFAAEIEYNRHEGRPNKILSLKTDGVAGYDMSRVKNSSQSLDGFILNLLSEVEGLSDLEAEKLIALPEDLAEDHAVFKAMDLFGYGLTEEEMYGKLWGGLSISSDQNGLKEITASFYLPQVSFSEEGKEAVFAAAKMDVEKFAALIGDRSELYCRIGSKDAEKVKGIDGITDEAIRNIIGKWLSEESICIENAQPIVIEGRSCFLSYTLESPSGFNMNEYSIALKLSYE